MRKHLRLCALLIALALMLSGCMFKIQESEDVDEISLPEPSEEPVNMILGERQSSRVTNVTLYYAMPDGTSFSTVTRSLRTEEAGENLLEAAVNALLSPASNNESISLTSGDTQLISAELACGIATVNLSIDARNVQSEQELLGLIIAISNTLLGLEGVKGVNVLIGNQSEGFFQLPLGVQTEITTSITAAYAQLQAERDHFLSEGTMPITRRAVLYFPSANDGWLVPELREMTFDNDDYAGALIEALKTGPSDSTCAITAIPDGVALLDDEPQINTLSSGERVLELNFSSTLANYLAFSGIEVWKLTGSIALTMCSFLPDIDAVRIRVNGEPITICEIGDSIVNFEDGLIYRDDFSAYIGSVVTLYLANRSNTLQPVKRAVSIKSALSPRSLLTELFYYAGNANAELSFPVPENIYAEDLLGIQVSNNIASINLSANFYRNCQNLDMETERNLVYSIVNTLCQLPDIKGVRFYIEGLSAENLAGNIYLKSVLMPNPGIIEESIADPVSIEAP